MPRGEANSSGIRSGLSNIRTHLDYISYLVDRRRWLAGDQFSMADIVAAAQISVIDYLGDVPWNNSNGAKEWSYPADGIIRFSPVIGSDGTIYFGSNDDNFYAVSPEGKLKWKYYSASDVKGSAAIGADGVIYFCTNDTKLHALNPN